ncbi:hypothetical protein TK06_23630 [Pseudomonas fluorescens]|uniref:Uncharacterized protein n=1 Tax=Pseudomonas fluorescens TaxID=294 RepID=A0A160A223_PSEFL|nr:hypothetical protein TK06_23630 [Pseudomonas fluorescens]
MVGRPGQGRRLLDVKIIQREVVLAVIAANDHSPRHLFIFVGFMDRELSTVELLHRWIGLLSKVLALPFAIILNFYCFSGVMDECCSRTGDFCGMNMADYQ